MKTKTNPKKIIPLPPFLCLHSLAPNSPASSPSPFVCPHSSAKNPRPLCAPPTSAVFCPAPAHPPATAAAPRFHNRRLIFTPGPGTRSPTQTTSPPCFIAVPKRTETELNADPKNHLTMKTKSPAKPAAPTAPAKAAAKTPARPVLSFRTILVPTDFSDVSRKALDYALPLARQHGAKIVLIHVVEPRIYPENILIPPAIEPDNVALMKQARTSLEKFRTQHIDADIPSEAVVALGKPFVEITNDAKAAKADLIVMPTHGFTGLKKILIGSTAERVVSHATCPVLIVRGA